MWRMLRLAIALAALFVVFLGVLVWRSTVQVRLTGVWREGCLRVRVRADYLRGLIHFERRLAWMPPGLDDLALRLGVPVRFRAAEGAGAGCGSGAGEDYFDGAADVSRRLHRVFAIPPLGPGKAFLSRRWRVISLDVRAVLGLGNPALTAVGYGLAWGVAGAALAALHEAWPVENPPCLDLAADFQAWRLEARGCCILAFKLGDAVIAGWLELKEGLSRRLVREVANSALAHRPAHPAGP